MDGKRRPAGLLVALTLGLLVVFGGAGDADTKGRALAALSREAQRVIPRGRYADIKEFDPEYAQRLRAGGATPIFAR